MKSPVSILFDINGIPTAVSASAQPLSGALGQVMAGFDSGNFVKYAKFDGDSLQVTGSVGLTRGMVEASPLFVTGTVALVGGGGGGAGGATETTLSAINAKIPSLGQAASAASTPVVLSNDYVITGTLDQGFVSVVNSTTTPLGGNATFTGTWEDITHYAGTTIIASSNVAGTLFAESSIDGVTVDRTVQLSDGTTGTFGIHTLIPISKYFRVRLVNGAAAQSSLRLQTLYSKASRITIPTSRYNTPITDYTNVLNTRSGIVGVYNATPPTLTDGDRSDVQLDANGRVIITLAAAVKDVSTAALSAGATYTTQTFDTINGQNVINISVASATDMAIFFDESSNGTNWAEIHGAALQAGLGKNETHVVAARYARVRYVNGTVANAGGIANLFLATSLTTFGNDTNVNIADEFGNVVSADSLLGLRVKPPSDTETFGAAITQSRISQLQANFSVALANNSVVSTNSGTGSSAATSNGSLLLTTGTDTTSSAIATTNAVLSYTPGREAYAQFTAAFTTPTSANSNQRIGLYDANNGFFLGFVGTTFSVTVRQGASDTSVGQSSFNGDTLQGNTNSRFTRGLVPEAIDFTKKNVFRIRFGWLGAAPIKFEVLSPDGEWVTFHTIRQPNTDTDPSIFSTALPIKAEALKASADTTSLVLNTSSWDAGVVDNTGIDFATAGSITALNGAVVANTSGKATTSINITGTWSGTLVFEAHNGDANWAAVNAYTTSYSSVANTTTNQFLFVLSTAYSQVRVRASSWTSGTATVQLLAANAQIDALVLPAGAATAANQTTLGSQTTKINDGTNTATVKAADTAAVAGDTALVVAVSPNNIVDVDVNATIKSSFSPDPASYALDTPAALIVDALNRLETHSSVTVDEGSNRDDFAGSSITRTLTGTLTFAASDIVTGSGTSFTTEIKTGDFIRASGDAESDYAQVAEVVSDTELVLEEAYTGTAGADSANASIISSWLTSTAAGGSISVGTSKVSISSGTTSGVTSYIKRSADYLPMTLQNYLAVSQRIANQTLKVGFMDDFASPTRQAIVSFSGTDNTQVQFITSFVDTETSTVSLPSGNTSTFHTYKIDVNALQCALLIDGIVVAVHKLHIPGPYDSMDIYYGMTNAATVTSTTLEVDYSFFYNPNRVQIDNVFQTEPLVTRLTDGSNFVQVKAASTAAVATDPALVVAISPNNSVAVTQATAANLNATVTQGTGAALSGYWPVRVTDGTNTMPTADTAARSTFSRITDGTDTAAVAAASTAAAAADPALVVALSPNNTPFQFSNNDRLQVGNDQVIIFDTFEGADLNTGATIATAPIWTSTSVTLAQSVSNGILTLNSGPSTAVGSITVVSNKSIRYTKENSLNIHFKARITTVANSVKEIGWGSVAGSSAPTNGVFIRVDSAGAILGVINAGGTETTTTLVSAGYDSANYLDFNIKILDTSVIFSVATSDGTTINVTSTVNLPITTAAVVTSASQPLFLRVYNTVITTGTSQIFCADIAATALDNGPIFADYADVTTIAASATNVTLLAANFNRRAVTIHNDSTQVLYIKYGATASTTSFTYRLTANSSVELPPISPDGRPWVGQIDGIWASAVGNARITEVQ